MRVLVTRPQAESEILAKHLQSLGCVPVIEPLLAIEPLPELVLDFEGVQALLVTSANGARAIAAASPRRDLPVFAVGAASAESCRSSGYEIVESADGDVKDLAELAIKRLDPHRGALLHAAASAVAGDLARQLTAHGFCYRREILYRAVPKKQLSARTIEALRGGELEAATFFSPRTARTFVTLTAASGLAEGLGYIIAYCLSANVAGALAEISWRDLRVAPSPDLPSLLALIEEDMATSKDREPL